jgi:hypothetical protein
MKTTHIFLAFIGILMYNVFLAQRDIKLLNAYDQACAELPQLHPNCRYAK